MNDLSFLQLQHNSAMTLLDSMSSKNKSNNTLLEEVIANKRAEYENVMQKFGVTSGSSQTSSNSAYKNVETSSENLLDVMESLKEESLYGVSEDSEEAYDNSSLLKTVGNFVTAYNNMFSNLNSVGGSLQNQFLPGILNAYSSHKEELESVGITQNSDGTLSLNEDTLKAVEPSDVQKVLGTDSSYFTSLKGTVNDMNEILGTALSYSSQSASYNSAGVLANSQISSFSSKV